MKKESKVNQAKYVELNLFPEEKEDYQKDTVSSENEENHTSHRRLLAVIGNHGRSKAFGNEILCMLTDGFQALFCNIFLIPLQTKSMT